VPRGAPGVAVVTGGSAGLGRAVARRLARSGWRVGLLARDAPRLADAVAELEADGAQALALPADVADPDAVAAAAVRAERDLGPVTLWVNAAMATVFAPLSELSPQEFRRVTEVTYLGQVHGTMAALDLMRTRGTGTVVLCGSALAYRGIPLQGAYCGAKFALRGFADSLRAELAHEGTDIAISMVQLPAMNTPQFDWARSRLDGSPQPVPPIYDPEDCAEAVLEAAASRRRELWVAGTTALVAVGAAAAPGWWLDRYTARRMVTGQQDASEPTGGRAGNLEAPVPGDFGAHGRFSARTRRGRRRTFDPDALRAAALAAGAGLAGAALIASVAGLARRARARRKAVG
jgi:NAD(P)-dependent dehydrogenase (short-subunit alcohol dehydrogenase family)